ncbi:MAG: CheR family methyltransferase [Pseudomonadota bacterium]
MTTAGFDELADLALRASGYAFRTTHAYLVESRLAHIMRRENFSTLEELANCLRARPNPVFEQEIVAALTSKKTRFFSDRQTLQRIVEDVLPRLGELREEGESLRILCAGGATGQEAYSLAILLEEQDEDALKDQSVEITSVDICKTSTERARSGLFNHFEIQTGLSIHRMLEHFEKSDNFWRASEALRQRISFRTHNLIQDVKGLGAFDVILCRNVLPPMASTLAGDLVHRLSLQLRPGGLIYLSDDESLPGLVDGVEASYDARGAYHRPQQGGPSSSAVA